MSQSNDLNLPPHSIEAEQSILGGLLLHNEAWDSIADQLIVEDFYRYDHQRIFIQIAKLINQSKPADVITVFEALQNLNQGNETDLAYLNKLAHTIPSTANIRRYAEIVRDHGILRRLIATSVDITTSAFNHEGRSPKSIIDDAETKILKISEREHTSNNTYHANALLEKVIEKVDLLYHSDNSNGITGTPTGFCDLDKKTRGLQPGNLVIVAGRPSMGKTSFAMNIVEHVAVEKKQPVIVFSLEMSAEDLMMRSVGSVGRLDQNLLNTGRFEDEGWAKLTVAIQKIQDAPLYIDDTAGLSIGDLRARARRIARKFGDKKVGLVVIDYLQLMSTSDNKSENRAAEVSEISRSLKALAKELSCPVIALSQLNRNLETRANKRPIMSDIRESGAIEQDADLILFVYRDEVYDPDSPDKGTAEIIIGKQRNGPIGTVQLAFFGEYTKFDNLSTYQNA